MTPCSVVGASAAAASAAPRTRCSGATRTPRRRARGAVDASEDSMFGAAGAAPARAAVRTTTARPPAPRGARRRPERVRLGERQLGDVSFADDSADEAPAPARRPQTIDALFDSDGRRRAGAPAAAAAPAHVSAAGRAAAPGRALGIIPTLPGMVAAPAADDGDPFPGLAPGPDEDDSLSSRTGASSRTGTTATTAAARHDDGCRWPVPGRDGLGEDERRARRDVRSIRSDDARLDAGHRRPAVVIKVAHGLGLVDVRVPDDATSAAISAVTVPSFSSSAPCASTLTPSGRTASGHAFVMRRCKYGPSRPGTESRACPPVQFYP